MNRNLIALGIAAAAALPLTAQASPKIYGKLFVTVEQLELDKVGSASDVDYTRLVSNDSRFGVRGETELAATLSAVYQIEWEVQADSAGAGASSSAANQDTADMKQRNRFIGIKHQDFGTLKAGAYDTYLKLAQGKVDFFNELAGDMKYVIAGENRISNVVGYESPKLLGGLTFNVMTQTQDSKDNLDQKDDKDPGATGQNGSSASIVYDNSDLGLYLAVAMDSNMYDTTALAGKRASDNLRAVASYKLGDLTLAGLYNVSEASAPGAAANEETGYTVGLSYKLGDQVLRAQWGVAEADDAAATIQERTLWSVGADHYFTSKTRALAFYTVKEESQLNAANDSEETVFGLGIEHSF